MQIVTSHKNTDFDGLASIIGITILYPDTLGVVPATVNNNVEKFLSTHKTAFNIVLPGEFNHEQVTRLTVVDTDQWRRLDRMDKLRGRDDLEIHIWDHHHGGDIEADWKCQEQIGATVTLIVREMKKRGLCLNALDSTILLLGLYEDTGHLTYRSTTAEDAYAAGWLLENGADLNVVSAFLNPPYEEVQREILFAMMHDTRRLNINNRAIGLNLINLDQKVKDLAVIVGNYRKIANLDAVFITFVIDEKRSLVIGRSGTDMVDAGAVMKELGGGGHPGAASATVKSDRFTAAELQDEIIRLLHDQQKEGIKIADIMSFPVTRVSPSATMREVQKIMASQKISGVLVTDDEEIMGIVVLWDFKKIRQKRQWDMNVKAFMSRKVVSIKPDALPVQAAELMTKNDIGHLPVVHDGELIGIVTRTDILTYLYGILPD